MKVDLGLLRAMLTAAEKYERREEKPDFVFSAIALQLLFWCFETNAPYSDEHARITGHRAEFTELYSFGLIDQHRKITERGQAFVQIIRSMRPPMFIDGVWK